MPIITDIPERDGLDGAAQLALLRSYLKDLVTPYKFSDDILIPLLVSSERVTVWRNIVGEAPTAIPWSYDPLNIQDPVTRVRLLTLDTDEGALKYTDAEILELLVVNPLRYVVSMILAKEAGVSTYPSNRNDPIRILRDYLDDVNTTSPTYTDGQLVDMIISAGVGPYGLVLQIVDGNLAVSASVQLSTSGGELASFDGISFSNASEALLQRGVDKETITTAYMNSPYWREDVYAWYVDGINMTEKDWGVKWYGI
jgi:hypothetical protein